MVYIVLDDSHELDDCWHGGSTLAYVSLNKDKAEMFLEQQRYRYMNLEGVDLDVDEPTRFSVYVGKWCYSFELFEVPEDTDLYEYFNM